MPNAHASDLDSQNGVPVLLYHEIVTNNKEPGETVIALDRFAEQMQYLHDHRYTTITIKELVTFMQGGDVPERAVVLTFDDGWKSVLNAVPILNQYNFKASFWIITEEVGKGRVGRYCVDWSDVVGLAGNSQFEIESHSMTHPWNRSDNLVTWIRGESPGMGVPDVLRELKGSKDTLEKHLGRDIEFFAWPCGWYTDSLVALAKSIGYRALLTVEDGINRRGDDVFRIRRAFIDGACDLTTFSEVLKDGKYRPCRHNDQDTRGHLPGPTKKDNVSVQPKSGMY